MYPATMPRAQAFVPFTNPPRVAFWTRAPPLSIGPFPCPAPLGELVSRFRPRVIPLTVSSPVGASDLFFTNGGENDPTRGIVVALVDVRQGAIQVLPARPAGGVR